MVAGCIYKHTKQTISDFLDNHVLPLLETLFHENKHILIIGDFNINLLNYDEKNTADFLDTMFSYSYLPFINTRTRVTGNSKTLIDNTFYNKPMLNITAGNISSAISDHLTQFLIEPSSSNAKLQQTCKLQRCYKNFEKAKFKNDLHKISWKENCSNPDSNVVLEHLLQIINKLLHKHAPYVMSKSRSSFTSKPWINTAIANSIKSKTKIYKKICKEKNPQQREIYGKQFKTYRNHLTTLLRITKDEYYKTHFQENKKDLKTLWKTIKEIINVKKNQK